MSHLRRLIPIAMAAAATAGVTPIIGAGALAGLIIIGLGGAIVGIVASTQGSGSSSTSILGTLSNFRP